MREKNKKKHNDSLSNYISCISVSTRILVSDDFVFLLR